MENERRKLTEEKIIRCAKKEFLEKGYAKANLREICKAAQVTTGALYFSFENKEALLGAIVDPVLKEIRNMQITLAKREEENPETAPDNEILAIQLVSKYREEILILMDKAGGSRYEEVREQIFGTMRDAFRSYYARQLGREPDAELIRIMAVMRFYGYLEIMKGNYDMEKRMFLTNAIGIHADAGTLKLIEYLKENDAHR